MSAETSALHSSDSYPVSFSLANVHAERMALYAQFEDMTFNDRQFFTQAYDQVAQVPEPKKALRGPFIVPIEDTLKHITKELEDLDDGRNLLVPGLLRERSYFDDDCLNRYQEMPIYLMNEVFDLALTKDHLLKTLGRQEIASVLQQTPLSGLDTPPYVRQYDQKDCTPANFSMIFSGITGYFVHPATLMDAALDSSVDTGSSRHTPHIGAADQLDVLLTANVKQQFDVNCLRIPVYGADFSQINGLIARIRSAKPKSQVYLQVEIGSERSWGVTHNSILLSSDTQDVIMHDPSMFYGRPYRRVPIEDFAARWARGLMRGNLVVAV